MEFFIIFLIQRRTLDLVFNRLLLLEVCLCFLYVLRLFCSSVVFWYLVGSLNGRVLVNATGAKLGLIACDFALIPSISAVAGAEGT